METLGSAILERVISEGGQILVVKRLTKNDKNRTFDPSACKLVVRVGHYKCCAVSTLCASRDIVLAGDRHNHNCEWH